MPVRVFAIDTVGSQLEAIRKREKIKWEEPKAAQIIDEQPLPMPQPVEGEKAFLVKTINIEGNTVIPLKDLRVFVADCEGKEVTFTQLQAAATAITNFYRLKGYVTSAAYFPPQKIEEGTVTIRIMEGKIDKIMVEGNRWFRTALIQKGVKQKQGDVLNYQKLENSLVKLNLHPDRQTSAVLIPGVQPETSDVVLKVKDKFPLHVGYSFDNLGTRLSGKLRQGFSLKDTNFLTLDDIMYAKAIVSDRHDLVGAVTDYQLPLHNGYGTRAGFNFSWIRSELGKELKFAKLIGEASTFVPSIIQPLYESQYLDAEMVNSFNLKDSKSKVFGEYVYFDSIRSWTFAMNLTEKDRWGRLYLGNEFNCGFGGLLGASTQHDQTSRPGVGGQFVHWDVDWMRVNRCFFETMLIYRGSLQVAQTQLLPAEQIRLGGAETIRGYPEGEYLGDYGFYQNVELRVPPYFLPKDFYITGTKKSWRDAIQLVHFIDVGKGFLYEHQEVERSTMMMAGTGMGLRVSFLDYINARFDWAWPIGDRPISSSPKPRFHFSLNVEY